MAKLERPANAARCYRQLCEHYNEPARHYHNLHHVAACFDLLEWYPAVIEHPLALKLAIWLHDVIYDTARNDNEQQSAAWADECMQTMGLDRALIQTVQDLILATDHRKVYSKGDPALLQDIDLGILGREASNYRAYRQAIRLEYQQYTDAEYRAGRKHVLESFLHRPRIYQTEYFYDLFENTARENMLAELQCIQDNKE